MFSQKAKEQPGLLDRVVLLYRSPALAERSECGSTRAGTADSAATLSQGAAFEFNDALAVVFD
ncbi:hypothetical protein, partial [Pseudomonas viridiflava]|uniref:hypothetical protein n=1 Tax=Pseudomonas viridiflava TaxID=33069 RepID=UPI00197EDB4A